MHDNAPCHKSALIKNFLSQNKVETIEWPAYSPDLNPIENLWAWIKQKLYSDFAPPGSKQELINNVLEIWDTITPEMCEAFCGNYEKRLQAVIKVKGSHTKY